VRVFIDTNVWLSARFRPGLCADLAEALIESGTEEVLADRRVIEEFTRIAIGQFGVPRGLLEDALQFFRLYVVIVEAAEEPSATVPDPDDAWIVAAAVTAGATWFVTGHWPLLALGRIGEMESLEPRQAYLRI
jgi:predicted nucleic acid-binding protein